MDIRFLIEQLDEITRRGFLTGLAATGAASYYGKQSLDKSKAEKKEKQRKLNNYYLIRAGDSKDKVYTILGKPNDKMDHGVWTEWTYYGPYLNSDIITVTFGNSYGTWKNLDGRVVSLKVDSKEFIRQSDSFGLINQEFDDEEAKIKQQARDIAKKFSPAMGAGPDDWKLEETSDEAIARIVELSKDKK